jgi:glycosyltransferase involved in cell wall biosynthesis
MRLIIATDAWRPQVNGVVRTYERIGAELSTLGHEVEFFTHNGYRTVPLPTYPEIRLALLTRGMARRRIEAFAPDHIHVATEGPIGLTARACCLASGQPFTTSYHTRFPEYASARFPIPESWGYAVERWFHNAGCGMMVSTPSLAKELDGKRFTNIYPWSRGVDTELFRPRPDRVFGQEAPVFLYVGRVAVEKNIEAFLKADLPGRKAVVGGGPQLGALRAAYPDVVFTGPKEGEELARCFSSADVFVFPSLTDTYGIVLLEAMASGLPVAAYPVTGPIDVAPADVGVLDDDIAKAALAALKLNRGRCRAYALEFSWRKSAELFLDNIFRSRAASGLPLASLATEFTCQI